MGRHEKLNSPNCQHLHAITARSAGIERIMCEACGHVSFSFVADLSKDIERDQFARENDSQPAVNP